MKNNPPITWLPPFLLGFMALAFQIIFMREFSVHFYGNEVTLGILLASWLFWGGLGSLMGSKFGFRRESFPQIYFLIILLFMLCLLGLRLSRFMLGILPGEITGMIPVILFALILSSLISFPLGILFVHNCLYLRGDLPRVYLFESLGATVAGILMYFVLIPHFSNWESAALMGGCISLLICMIFFGKKMLLGLAGIFIILATGSFFDLPLQKLYWKPFSLVASKDSRYGKIQILQNNEQVSVYNNGLKVFSYPDLETAEEVIHFALAQNPAAKNILLIGGGVGGSLQQLLKYPELKIDYVELDPEIISLSLRYLPKEEIAYYQDPRVYPAAWDGRAFLASTSKTYDIILLNLPDPASAQINRFYTYEFFLITKRKLSSPGVFSFRLSSAENYISPELQAYLASLYVTLNRAFPYVAVVPGTSNIFLASRRPLDLDPEKISLSMEKQQLQNLFLTRAYLLDRIDPLKQRFLIEKIEAGQANINSDLRPISYFFNSVLWSTQFKNIETDALTFLAQAGSFWLLGLPLLLFLSILILLAWKRNSSAYYLVPISVMGLTSIIFEIIVIIGFQIKSGYLYHGLALLLGAFMSGLTLGALRGIKRKNIKFSQLPVIQLGFILLIPLLVVVLNFNQQLPPLIFFLLLLLMGILSGDLFIITNTLYLKKRKDYGIGYAFDLFGSFLGALCVSSILIPLFGLEVILKYLFLFNLLCFLFLLSGLKRVRN